MPRRSPSSPEFRILLGPGVAVTCIRVRRGRVVLDYRDSAGVRRTPSFGPDGDEESWVKARRARARRRYLADEDAEILFEEAFDLWLNETRESIDPASHARYEEAGRLYLMPTFGGMRLAKLRRRNVKAFVLERLAERRKDGGPRFARSTVRKRMLGVLANFLQWAVDEEMLMTNPAREIGRRLFRHRKEETTVRRSMTEEQMSKWTHATERLVSGRAFLGLMLMLDGGLRIGEMLGTRVEDFDFDGNVIHVRRQVRCPLRGEIVTAPKTKAGVRDIQMSARIKEHAMAELRHRAEAAMQLGRQPCPWIAWEFTASPTRQEADVARQHYQRAMRKLCEVAGIGHFTPHALRHTWGTIQADHGASQKALQAWYGHATAQQTEQYIKEARPRLGPQEDQEPAGPDLLERIAAKRRSTVESIASARPTSRTRAR